MIDREGVTAVT